MMLEKEKLLAVRELKLSDSIIDDMSYKQFAEYCSSLDAFIEEFPKMEKNLKNYFRERNLDAFCNTLTNVSESLKKIKADNLSANSLKLLEDVKGARPEVAEAHLTYFLTSMSMLSIDIQMLQNQNSPSEEGQHQETAAAEREAPAPAEVGGEVEIERTVLAVDDVSLNLNNLKTILHNTEYKFVGVTSGAMALRFLQSNRPDLFILDIEMPGMNGYELAKNIRASGQRAPIIFLTGNATREYVLKSMQAGAVDFIVKPVSQELVLEKIRKYIG